MKRSLAKRPKNQHKILQDESQKLKSKLDNLKKQIEAKKKEKQSQKNTPSRDSTGISRSRKSNINNVDISPQLNELLAQLNVDKVAPKLKEKGINTIEKFKNLSMEEVDNWRDIAVGYRIKIRKYIEKHQQSQKVEVEAPPERKEKVRDIEAIVKNRKEEQIFVPLNRKYQEQQEEPYHQEELGEQQQEFMINSLMKAFKGETVNKAEELDKQFDSEIQSQEGSIEEVKFKKQKILVKPIQLEKKAWEGQTFPDYKYCWLCLQMVKGDGLQHQSRQFCRQKCLEKYKQSTDTQQENILFSEIASVEEKFNNYIQLRQSKVHSSKGLELPEQEEVDLQII